MIPYVLKWIDFGAKLDEGDPQTVFNSPQVQEIYMGISAE